MKKLLLALCLLMGCATNPETGEAEVDWEATFIVFAEQAPALATLVEDPELAEALVLAGEAAKAAAEALDDGEALEAALAATEPLLAIEDPDIRLAVAALRTALSLAIAAR